MIEIDTKKPFRKVGTHHGKFHADEVMATAILKEIYDLEVVRTRDPKVLKELDIVYDVGGGEFDHHDLKKIYRESGTPFAACGLIWRSFGKEVIRFKDPSIRDDEVDTIFKYVDTVLMEGIDAIDNGVKVGEGDIPTVNISSIISGFNPPWDSDTSDDAAFNKAVDFASSVLSNMLNQRLSIIRARGNVIDAYEHREMPEVMVLDSYCPWAQALQEVDDDKEVLYVVYPNRDGYAIQTVRRGRGTMEARKDLPKAWAGKRDTELGEIIGVEDAVFCHPGRFIAGARSFESIMKMADMAVNDPPEKFFPRVIWRIKKLVKIR